MSEAEYRMLEDVAEHDGQSVSDWIRLRVRLAHRKAFGDARPRKTKRKK